MPLSMERLMMHVTKDGVLVRQELYRLVRSGFTYSKAKD